MNKIIKRRMLPLVIGLGAVVVASCGGSSTSTPEAPTTLLQKNGALLTNVKRYSGVSSISNFADYMVKDFPKGSFVKGDRFAFGLDVNFDAVDTDPNNSSASAGSPIDWKAATGIDIRSAFTNFSLKSLDGNIGQVNLNEIKWAKCPLQVSFESRVTSIPLTVQAFWVTFGEAPNDAIATANCTPTVNSRGRSGHLLDLVYASPYKVSNFYDAQGNATVAKGARFTLLFKLSPGLPLPVVSTPSLKEIFSKGLEPYAVGLSTYLSGGYSRTLLKQTSAEDPIPFYQATSFASEKVRDYAPFELTATATAGGIDAEWKRSVDLTADDVATSVIETSKDNFANILTSAQVPSVDAVEKLSLASCDLDPKNKLKAGTTISLRVKALDKNGVASAYSDAVSVVKASDNIACPDATLAAPGDLKAEFGVASKEYSLSWQKPVDAEESEITYCVEWSSDTFVTQDVADRSCVGADTTAVIAWGGQATRSFRVVASSENGVVSLPSEAVDVTVPEAEPVTAVASSFADEGVKVSWTPSKQVEGSTGEFAVLKWGEMKNNARGPESGSATVSGEPNYLISRVELNESFAPGVEVWIDVVGCTDLSCSKAISTTILLPKAAVPLPEVEKPVDQEPEVVTTVAASPDTSAAPEASTSTTLLVSVAPTTVAVATTVPKLAPTQGCYIRGSVRGCGPYILRR